MGLHLGLQLQTQTKTQTLTQLNHPGAPSLRVFPFAVPSARKKQVTELSQALAFSAVFGSGLHVSIKGQGWDKK